MSYNEAVFTMTSKDIEILTDYEKFTTIKLGDLIPDWWGHERFNREN